MIYFLTDTRLMAVMHGGIIYTHWSNIVVRQTRGGHWTMLIDGQIVHTEFNTKPVGGNVLIYVWD